MFGFFTKRMANPVGLDSSLFWLTAKIEGNEKTAAANRVAMLCFAGLSRMNAEGIEASHFMRIYKKGEEEALKKYNQNQGSLTDASTAYISMCFFLLHPQLSNVDAKINFQKIVSYLENNASHELVSKIKLFLN